jgi:hypothetical protein
VLDDPNIRWLLFCILIIPACITLLAYLAALIAQRAGRRAVFARVAGKRSCESAAADVSFAERATRRRTS